MTLSESRRLQRNRRSTKARKWWRRVYAARMARGWEQCRNPGCDRLATTFGHLVPHAQDGRFCLNNLTLLCKPCNDEQGPAIWPWLRPLSEESEHDEKMKQACAWMTKRESG